jgi:hypothetical protein
LLVNADPQGSIPKPNKQIWQEKANLLGRFFAVATTFASQAPPLPSIPFAPTICEKVYMACLQVQGLPKIVMSISDLVLPYATDASENAEVNFAYAYICP